jgi:hypothetical protein
MTLAAAKRQASSSMLRRLGRRWRSAHRKHVGCRRVPAQRIFRCRIAWSARSTRRHATVTLRY